MRTTRRTRHCWLLTGLVLALVATSAPATAAPGPITQATEAAEGPGRLHPLTPARLLDTRQTGGAVGADTDRKLRVTGVGGVPSTGVSAVVLNVTVTGPTQRGDLQVYPVGQRPPVRSSNLNWSTGQTVAVQVQSGVGDDGGIAFSVSHGHAHVVVDVFGWYGDGTDTTSASGYSALAPARVLDTRTDDAPVVAGTSRTVPLAGRAGVPTGATAVMLNATMLATPAAADLQLYPTGQRPERRTSNLNVVRDETRANAVVVPLGNDGSVDLAVSNDSAHVVLDVLGYYSPDSAARFLALSPTRILDTRETRSPVEHGSDRVVPVAGRAAVPLNAEAAVLSVTATGASAPLDVQVYPPGNRPERRTSTLNLRPGMAVPNLAAARLGTGGAVALAVSPGRTDVVLDVLGYFTSATWSRCASNENGWTVEYPGTWRTNPGTVVAECRLFDPEPIVLQPNTELPAGLGANLHRAEVAVQQARTDPHSRLVSESETSVDGRVAYRQLRETTEDGYVPAGTRYLIWLVDLGNETGIGTTYAVGTPSFERKVEVLDAMMARISIDESAAQQPASWRELPGAPIASRSLHTATWAGDRLVVWSGGDDTGVHADGAAWIPSIQQWERVPDAPLVPRWNADAAWTGTELLVWGGDEGPTDQATCYTDGARYDAPTHAWRTMTRAPGDGRCDAAVAWSGSELLVFGGFRGGGVPTEDDLHDDGLAYDPDTDTWRALPPAPLSPRSGSVIGWTGSELVVWGGIGAGVEPVGGGAAYDPAAGTWRTIAPSPLTPRARMVGTFADGELVVLGGHDRATDTYDTQAAAYDPATDSWRVLADLPRGQVQPDLAWTGEVLHVVGANTLPGTPDDGAFLTYVPAQDAWVVEPNPPGGPRIQHAIAWSGARLYTWGGVRADGTAAPGAVWRPAR